MSLSGIGGVHDVGGVVVDEPLHPQISDSTYAWWEKKTHALEGLLEDKGLMASDELRRYIEGLHPSTYVACTYYEKWAAAMARAMIEKGVITRCELDETLGGDEKDTTEELFSVGEWVRVKNESFRTRWQKPHLRVPGFLFFFFFHFFIISIIA
jgi:nitrile hydratase subunit beta